MRVIFNRLILRQHECYEYKLTTKCMVYIFNYRTRVQQLYD